MPIFSEFNINLSPSSLKRDFSNSLIQAYASQADSYSLDAIQAKSYAESINLTQQTSILSSEVYTKSLAAQATAIDADQENISNIYGKSALFKSDPNKVSENYQLNSLKDSTRMHKLSLEINGKTVNEHNLVHDSLAHYNQHFKPSPLKTDKEVDIGMIADFLQDKYKVSISAEQKNFLRSQWNQASLPGIAGSLTTTGIRDASGNISSSADPLHPKVERFIFKEGKLHTLEVTEKIIGFGNLKGKTGFSVVSADISNLSSQTPSKPESSVSAEAFLPKTNAKSISISYSSTDLHCTLSPEVTKSTKQNSTFQSKSISRCDLAIFQGKQPSKFALMMDKLSHFTQEMKEKFSLTHNTNPSRKALNAYKTNAAANNIAPPPKENRSPSPFNSKRASLLSAFKSAKKAMPSIEINTSASQQNPLAHEPKKRKSFFRS